MSTILYANYYKKFNVFAKSTKMTKKLYNEKYLNILLH